MVRISDCLLVRYTPYSRQQKVLINNAASLKLPETQHLAELKDCSNSSFNSCVTSNALVTKAFVPLLRKSSWPRVIMNSSARGSLGRTANREVRR